MIKKIISVLLLVSLLSLFCLCFPSCATKSYESTCFEYFDTFCVLSVYAESQEEFDRYESIYRSMLKEYHELLDIYHEYDGINNLKTINDSSSTVTVDPKLGEFLSFGKDVYELTDGYTNIAMGAVLSLWHTARENEQIPSEQSLIEANNHVNIHDLHISEDQTKVEKADQKLKLDAGAVGKGFVAEKISEKLKELGCESFLLNLGGNLVSCGTKPDGSAWQAAIENPTEGEGLRGSVQISEYALATSGSYQRFFTVNKINYHHIIHPKTLYPENYCLSVSVLCENSALADALSTALFCMTPEDGIALLARWENVEALWLFEDGSIRATEEFMVHVKEAES